MMPAAFRTALRLPSKAEVDRRVPKNAFMEQIKGQADRKAFDAAVERLDWLATLSPASVGVASANVDGSVVEEVQVFALVVRQEPVKRLLQVIHQALPYPLVMVTQWPGATAARLSLWPRYRADGDMLLIDLAASEATDAFAASIELARLPRADLALLYDGLVERAQALWSSRVAQAPFRLPTTAEEAAQRKAALAGYLVAEAEWRRLKAAARAEKRLARAVELGDKAARAKLAMDRAAEALR